MINLEYRHYNTAESLKQAKNFIELINQIFRIMSEHDKGKRAFDMTIPKE
jgi:hypothetical protein